jgi:hypothetical protein
VHIGRFQAPRGRLLGVRGARKYLPAPDAEPLVSIMPRAP